MSSASRQPRRAWLLAATCALAGALFAAEALAEITGEPAEPAAVQKDAASAKNAAERPEVNDHANRDVRPARPSPSAAAALDDIPSYSAALVRMVVVLLSILVALFVLAKLLPRWLGTGAMVKGRGDAIQVIDSLSLEPRKRIYLVKVGGQHFLIGTSETGVHMLSEKPVEGAGLAAGSAEARGGAGDGAGTGVTPGAPASVMRSFASALSEKSPPTAAAIPGAGLPGAGAQGVRS